MSLKETNDELNRAIEEIMRISEMLRNYTIEMCNRANNAVPANTTIASDVADITSRLSSLVVDTTTTPNNFDDITSRFSRLLVNENSPEMDQERRGGGFSNTNAK
ncbi:16954_t:CDS:1 [Dentiscutata erythropus]|uniref:16954_t:CDS:1 n=1 Tax=Dentiscutata erythropus TaxID=1348616 RepID=A0A9N9BAF2_9GLOM|nr:16954_t:CDS:1 [Dentiscutata erythropus]